MDPGGPISERITRLRQSVASVLLALLLSGCVASESGAPPLVVLDLRTDSFRVEAQVAALTLADQQGAELALREPRPGEAWVRLEATRPSSGESLPVAVRFWAPFGGYWAQPDNVSLVELTAATATTPLFVPAEFLTNARSLLGESARPLTPLPAVDVASSVNATAGAMALLPLELATPRLRTMRLDSIDLYEGGSWPDPLTERIWLSWSGAATESFAHQLALKLSMPAPTAIRVVATGDIIPARCVYARHRARNDYTHAFQATADYLRAADIAVGSLDAAISDAGEPIGCEETFKLIAPARSVEGLSFAGFDVMSVATNHVMDCGAEPCGFRAFLDTLHNLRSAGIQPIGGGENEATARSPAVVTIKGVRFAFLAYDDIASSYLGAGPTTPGTAELSEAALREDIAAARRAADVVIVLVQWGIEYEFRPNARQREMARIAVEAGASLVVGNHPHVLQGVEWIAESYVAYALGNFVFDQDWSEETQQGAVLEATFVGAKLMQVKFIPTRIVDKHQPTWASAEESRTILDRVRRFSYGP